MLFKTFEEFSNDTTLDEATVDTSRYEFTHGKKPSGHATWFFSKHKSHNFDEHPDSDMYQGTGHYSAVKKDAVSHFKKQGHHGVIYSQT